MRTPATTLLFCIACLICCSAGIAQDNPPDVPPDDAVIKPFESDTPKTTTPTPAKQPEPIPQQKPHARVQESRPPAATVITSPRIVTRSSGFTEFRSSSVPSQRVVYSQPWITQPVFYRQACRIQPTTCYCYPRFTYQRCR